MLCALLIVSLTADPLPLIVEVKPWVITTYYGTDGFDTVNEIRVPTGRDVFFTVSSRNDALTVVADGTAFDFTLPRPTKDVPSTTSKRARFDKAGAFPVRCVGEPTACPKNGSTAVPKLIVMPAAEFDTWMVGQLHPADPIAFGREKFNALGCAVCHALDGSKRTGPPLDHWFGGESTLADGRHEKRTRDYFKRAIAEPSADILHGYPNVMPAYTQSRVAFETILQLLESLAN